MSGQSAEKDYAKPDLLGALARAVKAAKEDEQTMAQVRATIASRAEPQAETAQADRCPSRDPYGGTLRCGRRVHEDDQCQLGGIAWKKDAEPHMSDRERADRLEAMCDRLADRLAELPELWRAEGRAVMFNRAGDDLTPQGRVGKWLAEKVVVTPPGVTS